MINNKGISSLVTILLLAVVAGTIGYFIFFNLETILRNYVTTSSTNPKDDTNKSFENSSISPKIDLNQEFYPYENKELGIRMLIPKFSYSEKTDKCKKEIKVFQKPNTNELYIYEEKYSQNCEIQKVDTSYFGTRNADILNYFPLKVYNFNSIAELEKILKDNFGDYCKIDSIVKNEDKKTVKMDLSFFNSEEYKRLTNQGYGAYYGFCAYPGKLGSPMFVNEQENKIIFNAGPTEYLHFMYETKEWRKDYDAPMFNSITFIN